MDREKYIDESWKDSVANEKELNKKDGPEGQQKSRIIGVPEPSSEPSPEPPVQQNEEQNDDQNPMEVNFINYVSSLVFQTMIFLGELPNPMTNETDKNLAQAKFLIDTLVMLREKTKGNLIKREEELLNSAVYELQMRFIDLIKKENPQGGEHA